MSITCNYGPRAVGTFVEHPGRRSRAGERFVSTSLCIGSHFRIFHSAARALPAGTRHERNLPTKSTTVRLGSNRPIIRDAAYASFGPPDVSLPTSPSSVPRQLRWMNEPTSGENYSPLSPKAIQYNRLSGRTPEQRSCRGNFERK